MLHHGTGTGTANYMQYVKRVETTRMKDLSDDVGTMACVVGKTVESLVK